MPCQTQERTARPSHVQWLPCALGRRVRCAVGGCADRNGAYASTRVVDGRLHTLLPRQSASQQFDGDEIEDGVEVSGHGAR